jgi:hypothetical protein
MRGHVDPLIYIDLPCPVRIDASGNVPGSLIAAVLTASYAFSPTENSGKGIIVQDFLEAGLCKHGLNLSVEFK